MPCSFTGLSESLPPKAQATERDRQGPSGNRRASHDWKGGRSIKAPRLLTILSATLLVAAVATLVVGVVFREDFRVVTIDEVKSMPRVSGTYRSINNWKTVENTRFKGVTVVELLSGIGVDNPAATAKLIAPDGYFWPAVGDKLTVKELSEASPDELFPIVAFELDGAALDPEPDGSGPLRYVAPQYTESDVNKPSWVSNLRLIEVGPIEKGFEKPDAADVPVEEVWVYGNVPVQYPLSMYIPIALAVAGLAALAAALYLRRRSRKSAGGAEKAAALAALLLVLAASMLAGSPQRCAGQATSVFTLEELKGMPSFSGHYTFLKQLPPYTFYEADYTGVPLSYLLQEKLSLQPGAGGVVVRARDGYTANLSMAQVNNTFPGGLKTIIAYAEGGSALAEDEGPLRLIVPQQNQGNHDQGGDPNTPLCARMVYAVEVTPVPTGVVAPSPDSVGEGSLAVYGAVAQKPPEPAPAPAPSPSPAPAPQPADSTPQQSSAPTAPQPIAAGTPEDVGAQAMGRYFGGPSGLLSWVVGSSFMYALPNQAGRALWFVLWMAGV